MNSKYKIEYSDVLKEWIVWEIMSPNFMQQVYGNKYKKLCKKWLKSKGLLEQVIDYGRKINTR